MERWCLFWLAPDILWRLDVLTRSLHFPCWAFALASGNGAIDITFDDPMPTVALADHKQYRTARRNMGQ